MFERNDEKLMELKAEHEAKKMLGKMLSEMLLGSDAPESVKLAIRVMDKAKDISDKLILEVIPKYATPGNQANTETLKTVYEYLQLVEVGIKQFIETTPFVADTEEEEYENIL